MRKLETTTGNKFLDMFTYGKGVNHKANFEVF